MSALENPQVKAAQVKAMSSVLWLAQCRGQVKPAQGLKHRDEEEEERRGEIYWAVGYGGYKWGGGGQFACTERRAVPGSQPWAAGPSRPHAGNLREDCFTGTGRPWSGSALWGSFFSGWLIWDKVRAVMFRRNPCWTRAFFFSSFELASLHVSFCFYLACSFRAGITNSKPGEPLSAGFWCVLTHRCLISVSDWLMILHTVFPTPKMAANWRKWQNPAETALLNSSLRPLFLGHGWYEYVLLLLFKFSM